MIFGVKLRIFVEYRKAFTNSFSQEQKDCLRMPFHRLVGFGAGRQAVCIMKSDFWNTAPSVGMLIFVVHKNVWIG